MYGELGPRRIFSLFELVRIAGVEEKYIFSDDSLSGNTDDLNRILEYKYTIIHNMNLIKHDCLKKT